MAYAPIHPLDLPPGLRGDDAAFAALVSNHDQIYQDYTPSIDVSLSLSSAVTSMVTHLHFRVRGNLDRRPVRVRVEAKYTGGTGGSIRATVGAASTTDSSVTTSWTWISIDVPPTADGVLDCELAISALASSTVEIRAMQVYLVPSAPAAGTLASGFVRAGAAPSTAGAPVTTERVSRMLAGPVRIAIDRPVCLVQHVSDVTSAVKAEGWGVVASTAPAPVATFVLPASGAQRHAYQIDAFLWGSVGTITTRVKIGGYVWEFSGDGWASQVVYRPPGALDGVVSIQTGIGQSAAVRTLQIWRVQ